MFFFVKSLLIAAYCTFHSFVPLVTKHLFSFGIKKFQAHIKISTFSTDSSSFSPYISSRAEAALHHENFRAVLSLSEVLLSLSKHILWFINDDREQRHWRGNSSKPGVIRGRKIISEEAQTLMDPSLPKAGAQKKSSH